MRVWVLEIGLENYWNNLSPSIFHQSICSLVVFFTYMIFHYFSNLVWLKLKIQSITMALYFSAASEAWKLLFLRQQWFTAAFNNLMVSFSLLMYQEKHKPIKLYSLGMYWNFIGSRSFFYFKINHLMVHFKQKRER